MIHLKPFYNNGKKANIDEYSIKMIVGHAIDDITEKVTLNVMQNG